MAWAAMAQDLLTAGRNPSPDGNEAVVRLPPQPEALGLLMAADNASKEMLTRWEAAHAAGKIPDPNSVCCSSNRCLHGLLQRDYAFVEKIYAPLYKLTMALQRKDKQASVSLPPVPRNSKKQFAIKLGDDSSSSSCESAGGAAGSCCSRTAAAASDGACCMLRLPCHMSCNTKT